MKPTVRFDRREYRDALGSFITGVTIISTLSRDGTPTALTVNSFNSVSLEPPMVLWSLAKDSYSLPAFESNEHWAVHILSVHQESLSQRFAKRGTNKFEGVSWTPGIAGIPILDNCSSVFQCKTAFKYEGGDHIILVGEVIDFQRCDASPLAFHAGKYAVATRKLEEFANSDNRPEILTDSRFEDGFIGYLLPHAAYHLRQHLGQMNEMRESGLTRDERVLVNCLCLNGPLPAARIDELIVPHGAKLSSKMIDNLRDLGLLQISEGPAPTTLSLTHQGQAKALHLLAAAKSMESKILDQIGYWEAQSLKHLLKQLILTTAGGQNPAQDIPPPSDTATP